MNLRQLECLVTVIDEGHFGRAAARLHISASALSRVIRRLETQLRITVIDRDVHPVRPTKRGAEFVEAAREVLAAAEHAWAVAAAAHRGDTGVLVVGFVTAFAGEASRTILDRFAALSPGGTVELVELPLSDQTDAVLRSSVDASFARGPVRRHPQLRFDRLLRERRVLAVAALHRLAGRARVGFSEFAEEPLVRLSGDVVHESFARWWAADPRPDGSPVRYGPSIRTDAEYLEAVASGRAVGITTASFLRQFARSDIAYVEIDDLPPSEVFLCTRLLHASPAIDALREAATDALRIAAPS